MNELLKPTSKEAVPPLVFSLPAELSKRKEVLLQAEETVMTTMEAAETVDPTAPANELVESVDINEMVEQVAETSTKEGLKLRQRFDQIGEAVSATGHLLGAVADAFRLLGAACPHCVMSVVQTASGAGKMFGVPGFGGEAHWHADGTYHDTAHQEVTGSADWFDNPFKWLEVDNSPSVLEHAA